MRGIVKICCAVLIAHLVVSPCHAFNFSAKNGPRIKSDDGQFEIGLNARAQLDVHSLDPDHAHADYPAFGSQRFSSDTGDGFNWRRTYLTLTGKVNRLNFKFENDLAVNATTAFPHSLREAWIATQIGPGQLTIGQFKPYRSLEELTSSNEITMMERPSTSQTGMYSGRQFQTGIGYKAFIRDNIGFGIDVMSLSHFGLPLGGMTYGGRGVWLPIDQDGNILHLGFSINRDTSNHHSLPAQVVDTYGGREGVQKSLGMAGAALGAPHHNSQTTFSTEAAYAFKSFTLQGEYAIAKLDNTHRSNDIIKDSLVQAYYVQASWFLTGEQVVYRRDRGAFGKPLPANKWGAWELTGRYDVAENLSQSLAADPCKTGTSKCKVEIVTLGMNWYPFPNIRFMANYYLTEALLGNTGLHTPMRRDHLFAFSFRTQISF